MKIKKKLLAAAACAAVGYNLGGVNPAYVVGLRNGYDIRMKGSGNAGATNTMLLEGKKAGIFVMAFDISKAAVSVSLCRRLFPGFASAGETAGTACILGHMFPARLNFHGGKGLACLGGTILAFGVEDFALALFMSSVLLLSTKYLCLVPISASVLYPIYHGMTSGNWEGAAILGTVALPIFAKHLENLRRIAEGKELRVNFLWDRDEELARIGWVSEEELERHKNKN